MLLKLEAGDSRPLHEQVAGAIRRAVGEGECVPGERLPCGAGSGAGARGEREHGAAGTAGAAGRRGTGVPPGRGITVARGADRRAELLDAARRLVADAAHAGFSREELVEMIRGLE